MKSTLKTAILGLGLAAAMTTAGSAVTISGTIDIVGPVTTTTAAGTTTLSFPGPNFIVAKTGHYSGATGNPTISSVSFSSSAPPVAVNSTPISPLWTLTNGPTTYSFALTSGTVTQNSASFFEMVGTGIASITGYEDTFGTWYYSSQGSKLSFSSQTSVPDGGTTAALLGVSLLGLAGARRKFSR